MQKRLFLQTLAIAVLTGQTGALHAQANAIGPVLSHYGAIVSAAYEDTLGAALDLQRAVTALTAKPSVDALDAARKAWLHARESYGQTEAFRFYGGPIDDDKGPEGRLNAWQMEEDYVD